MMGRSKVSWIIVRLPCFFELPSFDSISSLSLLALSRWSGSNLPNNWANSLIFSKYLANWGSLAYSMTNLESPFATNSWTPIFWASHMPTSSALYFTWLCVRLKLNFKDCSTTTPSGPSNTIPAPLPTLLTAPLTNNTHGEDSICWRGACVSSTTKLARTWPLTPLPPTFSKMGLHCDSFSCHFISLLGWAFVESGR